MNNISSTLTSFTEIFSGWIAMPLTITLIGTGVFVTLSLGFIQLKRLKHSFEVVLGKYDNPDDEGDVTHFQALSAALSATIGIGILLVLLLHCALVVQVLYFGCG